jgi:hypothetical protein
MSDTRLNLSLDLDTPAAGTALLYNATASKITQVAVTPAASAAGNVPAMSLFTPSPQIGSSVMSGCSFAIPTNRSFTVTVTFQSGQQVSTQISTASQESPALYFVAFLNGLVATNLTGRASNIQFSATSGEFISSGDLA